MNATKISLIIVAAAFIIAGVLIVSARLSNNGIEKENSSTAVSYKSSSSCKENKKESSISENEQSSTAAEESSATKPGRESVERDENGVEIPYDVTPIVNAYFSGDRSSLDEKEIAALDAAIDVLSEITNDNMSDYEKELAIHDHIILNNEYNDDHLNVFGESSFDDSSPYGTLVNHKSICKGYATTFKLLCNMCGIECELIIEYDEKEIEHAYDRVNLENSWYYVDVTWDDHTDIVMDENSVDHTYFNITLAQLSENHFPDESCPETVSDKYTFAANNIIDIYNKRDFENAMKEYFNTNHISPIYMRIADSFGAPLIYHQDPHGFDYQFDESEKLQNYQQLVNNITDKYYYVDFSKITVNNEVILRIKVI